MCRKEKNEMDYETLKEAKNLESLIKATEINIKGWEEIFEASEVQITSETAKTMFLTNPRKDEVKNIIINSHKKKLAELKERFEKL
jgi:hypothetical protein